jgi:hypothetical protein
MQGGDMNWDEWDAQDKAREAEWDAKLEADRAKWDAQIAAKQAAAYAAWKRERRMGQVALFIIIVAGVVAWRRWGLDEYRKWRD